ncbi:hypothetical protein CCH79_00007803 [Gambusia affinis]|uniref:Uncharacterized protein n=1 Tax=Gambusia affinis TaxID=33528 RepID=A0A315W1S0_GAMAF|nr:hypothetical protein CCH79_00007803 [Gambusia affinis]
MCKTKSNFEDGPLKSVGATHFKAVVALVPFFLPLGFGLGYAVTTGLKKVCDRYFPGKDSDEGGCQDDESDLFWKGFSSDTKEQTDRLGRFVLKRRPQTLT